jgi:hypothetical protein
VSDEMEATRLPLQRTPNAQHPTPNVELSMGKRSGGRV